MRWVGDNGDGTYECYECGKAQPFLDAHGLQYVAWDWAYCRDCFMELQT